MRQAASLREPLLGSELGGGSVGRATSSEQPLTPTRGQNDGYKRDSEDDGGAASDSDDSDGDSDGDSAMDECEDIVIERLMKLPKELLKEMCKAYGVETSGSKQDLAELVGEQLTNETGDEDDEDDEDD